MSRQLATIQKISKLSPIEGADRIEMADVQGWHVVVERGLYAVGDKVVYCEVDSLLPIKPEFEFLAKGSKPKKMYIDGKEVEGYRIKTIKLRGQISQGIVFPLSILTSGLQPSQTTFEEGLDVTDFLGIHKYEMPLPTDLQGKARGGFPGFFPKTDETRLQSFPTILETYKDIPFFVTEKIDGSSVSFFIKNDEFHAVGRTIDWLEESGNTIWRVAKEMQLEQKLRNYDLQDNLVLQGEIFGPGIQKNPLRQSQVIVRFFNAYDFNLGEYLSYERFVVLLGAMDLPTVPIIDNNFKLLPTVDEMVQYTTRSSVINPDVKLEGLVFRPLNEQHDPDLGRLSFKVISPEYLLKHDA